ncbi:fibronectin type III domain-containing protein [Streptomyces diastatochromogenes]|uniref:fibronectin type III domain-containing protein n=1 Tax=Streptomyces diastatochromogenes TaxID=42236 RepID=UPI0036686A88
MATRAVAATLCCSAALFNASSAVAADVAPRTSFTADPLATWQTDGIVWSLAYANGVVYAGGTFDAVRPPGAAPGKREIPRHNFAAFDAVTGALLPCAPSFTGGEGTVRALKTSPDGKVLYVGGSFSHVGSTGVASAVALDTAHCSLRKEFRPAVSATVRAIETTGDAVYLGGDFNVVDGKARNRVAALAPTGGLLSFAADIDRPVRALSAVPSRHELLVGGDFDQVNGERAHALVALDSRTGASVRRYPDWLPLNSTVRTITNDGNRFYLGADGHGPGSYDGRIAGRLDDGSMAWYDNCQGATQAVLLYRGVLYSGSHAHNCSQAPGGFPERHDRQHLLAQSPENGRILHWFPDTDDGLGEPVGPRAMTMAGDILWVSGEFTKVNNKPQQSLTRFAAGPDTEAPKVPSLALSAASPGKVAIRWQASWDRDDASLTYLLYRDGKLVSRQSQSSTYWDRPWMSFTDSVPAGTRHQYRIEVTDGKNTSRKSPSLNVAVPAKAAVRGVGDPWT